jgi:hypothetical protein
VERIAEDFAMIVPSWNAQDILIRLQRSEIVVFPSYFTLA